MPPVPTVSQTPPKAETAAELRPPEYEREVVGILPDDLQLALVPDDHRAAPPGGALVDALELTRRQRVVLDRNGEAAHRRIQRRPLRDRPRPQDAADLEPKVEVKRHRVVKLDYEPRR